MSFKAEIFDFREVETSGNFALKFMFQGGGNITAGYYKLPGKTDEEYFTDPSGRRWFRSGDIGQIGTAASGRSRTDLSVKVVKKTLPRVLSPLLEFGPS